MSGRPLRTAVVVAIAVLSAASCASGGGGQALTGTIERNGADGPVVLRVLNGSIGDFDVHVMHTGDPALHRLGRVMKLETAEFELPHEAVTDDGFYLVAQPVGTTTGYVSALFRVMAGERIAARIAPTTTGSGVAFRSM